MEKVDFNTPEWQEYFKDKSPEEIEEIKKKLREKDKEITQRKDRETGLIVFLVLILALALSLFVIPHKKAKEKARNEEAKSQQLERKIPLLESGFTDAMKADTKHISDAKVKVSMSKEGKYLVTCNLYFKPDISKDVITFYCKSVCEKSFAGYPDIDYNRTIIRGYKNEKLIKEYSPLTEKSEKVDEARSKKRTQSVWSSPRPSRREIDKVADAFRRELGLE